MGQPYMLINSETAFYSNPQGVKFAWDGAAWQRVTGFPADAVEAGTGDTLPEIPPDVYETPYRHMHWCDECGEELQDGEDCCPTHPNATVSSLLIKRSHTGCIKGFHQLSRAWYAAGNLRDPALVDEITFGWYVPDDGTTGEMQMRWEHLAGAIVPHLIVFDDAWHALATFTDVLQAMGERDGDHITPAEFCTLLQHHGFTDLTKVEMEA